MIDIKLAEMLSQSAKDCALAAGSVIRERSHQPYKTEVKRHGEIVTEVDKLAQNRILALLEERHPEHTIIAEESPETHPQPGEPWSFPEGIAWVIDPIDGTSNFANSLPIYSVSVGVVLDGKPFAGAIYDPTRDELFAAGRGIGATLNDEPMRLNNGSSLNEALVAGDWGWGYVGDKRLGSLDGLRALAPHTRTVRVLGSAALGLCYVAADRVDIYLAFGLHPWDVVAGAIIVTESGGSITGISEDWWPGASATMATHPDLLSESVALVAGAVQ